MALRKNHWEAVMEENNSGSKFIYFLAGVGIGAVVGILFAPQSGRETRELIAGRAEESKEFLVRKGREIREQANEYVERSKGVLSQQREHLAAAIEAGKQAYRVESQAKNPVE
jgi:gas vesicle protein